MELPDERPLVFLGTAHKDVCAFPDGARRLAGYRLDRVLHAFEKKSQQTNRRDLALGQLRYRQLLADRNG
ncbi:MAG: hypothetical protein AAF809_01630 [Bacteroidota bacterium]